MNRNAFAQQDLSSIRIMAVHPEQVEEVASNPTASRLIPVTNFGGIVWLVDPTCAYADA